MSEVFDPNEWITSKEAAEISGFTQAYFRILVKRRRVKSVKRGNTLFFQKNDILEFLAQQDLMGRKKFTPLKHRATSEMPQ